MIDRHAKAAIIFSNSIAAQSLTPKVELFACPLCGRCRFRGEQALWQHLRARHSPLELPRNSRAVVRQEIVREIAAPPSAMPEWCEDAFIRIANAPTLERAVEIATAALMGDDESDVNREVNGGVALSGESHHFRGFTKMMNKEVTEE